MTDEIREDTLTDLRLLGVQIFDCASTAPPKAQVCIALKAFGWGPTKTAKLLGCTKENVDYYVKKYDPGNLAGGADVIRKLVINNVCGVLMLDALTSFKPGELKDIGPMDRLRAVKMLADIASKMEAAPIKQPNRANDIVAGLKHAGEEIEGEVTDAVQADEADAGGEES